MRNRSPIIDEEETRLKQSLIELLTESFDPFNPLEDEVLVEIGEDGRIATVNYSSGERNVLDESRTRFSVEIDGGEAYLTFIGRNTRYRGNGLGTQLYEVLEKYLEALGVEKISLCPNEGRKGYWESQGFELGPDKNYVKALN